MIRGDTPPGSPQIAIVGAGIAGLTAALCLARVGWRAMIFERAAALEEVGAGLQLSPNALSVMAELGLLPALTSIGVEADRVTLLAHRSGRRIAAVPVAASDGTPYLSIHRADLQSALLSAVQSNPAITLRLGPACTGWTADSDGVTLSFENGAGSFRAALAIGADGVRSALAKALGAEPAAPTGATAWRTTLSADALPSPAQGGPAEALTGINAWLGPARHAVAYPIRAGQAVNLVLITPDEAAERPARQQLAGFATWDGRLAALIERAPAPTPWPLFATPKSRRFVGGGCRIALIGDAAHAMAPYAAQGAGMAIEDAAVLAHALAETGDPIAATRRYEIERRPRIDKVRRRVGFHRFVYHLPPPLSFGRDAVLALRPKSALRADLAWLYDWRSPRLT
ncbi:FAD-dependent monooxygenase [Jiella sp. MQZ9-1]|uniref:FAD-dependent monooxygenase n=1 Tax=Jiella flava TaxID=2816857 RepID=A0A939FZG2_9HYPH|nr:FAD-dependent monooxygenase [Jiella flava]MBO0662204.1 FAD-dependent monooxygenase [Jiella flava]MCD2470966.1 FAD-dependent monooxygenase [Jiella flava]